jgi:hypothetical protein
MAFLPNAAIILISRQKKTNAANSDPKARVAC